MPVDPVHARLEALYAATDGRARVASDPVRFAHRYRDPRDAEVAGLVAASLAYGAVDLFLPVLDRVFATLDDLGGPRRATERPVPTLLAALDGVVYRWNRGRDLAWLLGGLRRALGDAPVEALLDGTGNVKHRLEAGVQRLRTAILDVARESGAEVTGWSTLPQGTRYLLPAPTDGSGCKRLVLYLRWMVRPTTEGVDLGLWRSLAPADLVMPIDVHVARLSGFLGLLDRPDAGWAATEALTARLRAYDPDDPVRFDFALAHHGISDACLGHRAPDVCARCVLDPVCRAPDAPTSRPGRRSRPS